MSKHTRKLLQPAEKTIEVVLDEFLEEQQKRLKPSTGRKYEDIIDLFRSFLDGYAYQSLNKQENALFDRLYYAEGDEHREFCQVFGPEKIPGSVGEFLNYFMIRKVMCDIRSIAIPKIGAGYGGLPWEKVQPIVEKVFNDWPGTLYVYGEFVQGQ